MMASSFLKTQFESPFWRSYRQWFSTGLGSDGCDGERIGAMFLGIASFAVVFHSVRSSSSTACTAFGTWCQSPAHPMGQKICARGGHLGTPYKSAGEAIGMNALSAFRLLRTVWKMSQRHIS